jgi:hypothetical protein
MFKKLPGASVVSAAVEEAQNKSPIFWKGKILYDISKTKWQ